MKKAKLFICLLTVSILLMTQVLGVSAAASYDDTKPIIGTILEITLDTDLSTGVTTVLITLDLNKNEPATVRLTEQTAFELGLLDYNVDGNPFIVEPLPEIIEIDPEDILPDDDLHPVGSALATFFSDIPGLEYATIIEAYDSGTGFGVIAQALWLTRKLGGDAADFITIIEAKKSGDFSSITLSDGTNPLNWGQFRKAVLDGETKGNLGIVISSSNPSHGNGIGNPENREDNSHGNNANKDKEKDNRRNNGNGNGNGNGNPNRP
jgi:hypothetical protein